MFSEENRPMLIKSDINYGILKQVNEKPHERSQNPEEYFNLKYSEIESIPGATWMYGKYSDQHLNILRMLHLVGFLQEVLGLILGESLSEFEQTSHTVTPFTFDHKFAVFAWILVTALGVFFIAGIFERNILSMELVADQYGYLIFPGYLLEAMYLTLRNIKDLLYVDILRAILLGVLSVIMFLIYRKVKYPDDGRYVVSRVEYLGVHLRLSLIVAWIFICFIHQIFMCLSYSHSYNGDAQLFLNWENSNWSILAMSIAFALGVIFLSTYKDVFFSAMLAYAFLGIYFMQAHEYVCQKKYEDNCSTNVSISAIVFASCSLVFSGMSLLFFYDKICYKQRNN